jgi:hypothetical protein
MKHRPIYRWVISGPSWNFCLFDFAPVPFYFSWSINQSIIYYLWFPFLLLLFLFRYHLCVYPVQALPCVLSYFCLGSSTAPFPWSLLLCRLRVAFIERRLFLLILFIIYFAAWNVSKSINKNCIKKFEYMKELSCGKVVRTYK